MKMYNYKLVIYFITITIVTTIAIQIYWNVQNYTINKQRLINDVQISLDNSLELYFSDLSKLAFSNISKNDIKSINVNRFTKNWNILLKNDTILTKTNIKYSLPFNKNIKVIRHKAPSSPISIDNKKAILDTISDMQNLAKKVIVSIVDNQIEYDELDTYFKSELHRKNLILNYGIVHYSNDSIIDNFNNDISQFKLSTYSKSTYLPHNQKLKIYFSNPMVIILKKGITGIIFSFLLSISIISCLLYLLKIIKQQKQLAEMKNDLISNITHEFKTPIATIGVAIESIKNFNVIDDKEKTKNYLDVSNEQLSKLNIMVEKLLETASLDSDSLKLNKEEINVSDLLDTIANKHKLQTENKTINFFLPNETVLAKVDVFHFENAINNVLDNAIKYGGDTINIGLSQNNIAFTVSISDNGNTLIKANKDKIFEKFYRVPKGNTHDIKGFGIGLYYTKKIIEKHNGAIHLDLGNMKTTFKISLPNE